MASEYITNFNLKLPNASTGSSQEKSAPVRTDTMVELMSRFLTAGPEYSHFPGGLLAKVPGRTTDFNTVFQTATGRTEERDFQIAMRRRKVDAETDSLSRP